MKHLYKLICIVLLITLTLPASAQTARNRNRGNQTVEVTGIVLDDEKQPIIGAVIIVKGTTVGVSTNHEGKFKISAQKTQYLEASYLGYKTQFRLIGDNTTMNFNLTLDEENTLDEIVVIGYGEVAKSDLTGAVASVKAEVFEKSDGDTFLDALAGKVSGIDVVSDSGMPGASSTIRIRGSNSLDGDEPLYIIDGVFWDTSAIDDEETDFEPVSPLSMINPADIASMEILKDASATAIYGAQGSNGVIIITTKMGQSGKPKVALTFKVGLSSLGDRLAVVNTNEYYVLRDEAFENGGSESGIAANKRDRANRNFFGSYNWQDVLLQTGTTYDASMSISGGTADLKYMLSFNYYQKSGVVIQTDFERVTTRLNLDFKLADAISAGLRLSVADINTSGQPSASATENTSVINSALKSYPYVSSRSDNYSKYDPDYAGLLNDETAYNPLQSLNAITQYNESTQISANIFVNYTILPGLVFKPTFTYGQKNSGTQYYMNRNAKSGYNNNGVGRVTTAESNTYRNENTLSYNKNFGTRHKLSAVVGFTEAWSNSTNYRISGTQFPNDDLLFYDMASAEDVSVYTSTSESSSIAVIGRANYTLDNKFTFTFTGRMDGASKFADRNKYGFFPAGAFSWRLNQENWLKDYRDISNLKFRLSYGLTGNQNIQAYSSLTKLSSTETVFGDSSGSGSGIMGYTYATKMADSELQWSSTNQVNVGFDLGMFKNKLTIETDYYYKDTRNMIITSDVMEASGYNNIITNYGNMTNSGFEFMIKGTLLSKTNFKWNASFNISFNKTIVVDLETDYYGSGYSSNGDYTQMLCEGAELGLFWGYHTDGIIQEGEDVGYTLNGLVSEVGDQKYIDVNGDGVLDDADRGIIGYAQPICSGGFNTTFNIYDFSVTFYFNYRYGNDIMNLNGMLNWNGIKVVSTTVMDRWTADNPSNEYPKLLRSPNSITGVSDAIVYDGDYVKLKTINVGYSVPKKYVARLRLTSVRVSASVSNIFTITNYTAGYSPDVSLGGASNLRMGYDRSGYPQSTTYSFNLNIGF